MDLSSLFGIIIGALGILLGNALEGGHLSSLMQFTAGIIVFGGTIGATMLANKWSDIKLALKMGRTVFQEQESVTKRIAQEIYEASQLAKKETILALEPKLRSFSHPYMKRVFRFVVDGADVQQLKHVFEESLFAEEERMLAAARVWSDAGGYAPTIGILGAVLGLIHVMGNLSNTDQLGAGIAVAFVATIYGVGAANLIFLPIGSKLKRRVQEEMRLREMILEGGICVLQGMNPHLIKEKLRGYYHE